MKTAERIKYIVSAIIIFAIAIGSCFIRHDKALAVFTDIDGSEWYCPAVQALNKDGIIPSTRTYCGEQPILRKDVALYLYNLNSYLGGDNTAPDKEFIDVNKNNTYYTAAAWADANELVVMYPGGYFNPNLPCTREQICEIAIKYFRYAHIRPKVNSEPEQFADSLSVTESLRSYVVAARMCDIIKGDEGYFYPSAPMTRGEYAGVLSAMVNVASNPAAKGEKYVKTTPNAYDRYYDAYIPEKMFGFESKVEKADPVDPSYFDDAAFVGDSVSASLQFYCAANGALGKALFLCAGSLGPSTALQDVTDDSKHPTYEGVKCRVEDAIARSGVKKVYIMLGINDLRAGEEICIENTTMLIERILEQSPDVNIIIQSVTPMTEDSPIYASNLNNEIIYSYNAKLQSLAIQNGWYFVNVAECVSDENGYLKKEFCSDPRDMGIHFNYEADEAWVEYLRTHAPNV